MDTHELAAYREAGRIASDCRNWASAQVRPGLLLRELQEGIEARIRDAGALPSFPAQTSRNEIAAHYCAFPVRQDSVQVRGSRKDRPRSAYRRLSSGHRCQRRPLAGRPVGRHYRSRRRGLGRRYRRRQRRGGGRCGRHSHRRPHRRTGLQAHIQPRRPRPRTLAASLRLSDTQQRPTRWPAPPARDDFRYRTVRNDRRRLRSGRGQGGSVHEVRRTDDVEQNHHERPRGHRLLERPAGGPAVLQVRAPQAIRKNIAGTNPPRELCGTTRR